MSLQENYFHFFYSLFLNFLSTFKIFFTLAKVTFISWLFLLFTFTFSYNIFLHLLFIYHCYRCYHEWFPSILCFQFVFFITPCFDLLPWFSLYLILGWFCTYCFWPFTLIFLLYFFNFLVVLFWSFTMILYLLFFGGDFVLTVFWPLPWFSYFTFSIFWLFCSHCFCLFPRVFLLLLF